ncbi:MAG: hypothetical protein ACI8TA_003203, partial [Cyclobacteriaceae bacterium]
MDQVIKIKGLKLGVLLLLGLGLTSVYGQEAATATGGEAT